MNFLEVELGCLKFSLERILESSILLCKIKQEIIEFTSKHELFLQIIILTLKQKFVC